MTSGNVHRRASIVEQCESGLPAELSVREALSPRVRMGVVARIFSHWVGLAILAVAIRASAVEATLVADTHVNAARPAANSGSISNLNVGGGYTALLQFDLGTLP